MTASPRTKTWRIARWTAAAILLSVPWVMMQVSDEWNWRPESFVLFGALLATALGLYEWGTRVSGSVAYRVAIAIALVTGFVVVWMNLAVGIIGPEDNPANLMYLGVLGIGAAIALVGRLRPRAMAFALLATTIAQGTLTAIVLIAGERLNPGATQAAATLILNLVFGALFLTSALLFRRAAKTVSA